VIFLSVNAGDQRRMLRLASMARSDRAFVVMVYLLNEGRFLK
jgi:hypothetical protein